ncbi:hypothetical protein R1flu_010098 [Riccia fluitans]|uniref:Uncharacterized protein n=1 Tax=Riccia fluitans TaxID=41844 RepID=A0ABD1Z4C9_9MARC
MFPPEVSRLNPEMGRLDARGVVLLLKEAGVTELLRKLRPLKAFAEGGTLFLMDKYGSEEGERLAEIIAISKSPASVRMLPRLYVPPK